MPDVIDLSDRDEQAVARAVTSAAQCLRDGHLVVIPEEAGYHLLADASSDAACQVLLNGAEFMPVVWGLEADGLLADVSDASGPGALTRRLSRRCWPGPVVLDVTTTGDIPAAWSQLLVDRTGADQAVRLGVPLHEISRALLNLMDSPLLATPLPVSPSGQLELEACTPATLILQAGPTRYQGGDTTIRVRGDEWEITREGVVGPGIVARLASQVIIFVCTGNTCRSPMAEALFRKLLTQRLQCPDEELVERGFLVGSAGVAAYGGSPISPEAADSLRERGIDSSSHVSQPVTAELAQQADLLVTMTQAHRDALLATWPDAATRVRLLDPDGHDVADPIGGSAAVYAACCQQIENHLEQLAEDWLDLPST
tara:strand:+ start:541 stop:1650 length:1110 start_codon:yes stop_codon:yes gene_type:complete